MSVTLEFVGGPYDGQLIAVPEFATRWVYEFFPGHPLAAWAPDPNEAPQRLTTWTGQYVLAEFMGGERDGEKYFRWDGFP